MLHNQSWWPDVQRAVRKGGVDGEFRGKYQKIGSGAYSVAYQLSDTVAMKITKGADPAAWTYLRWCQRNQGKDASIPVIHYLEKYSEEGGFVCVMKLYSKFVSNVSRVGDSLIMHGVSDTVFDVAIENIMREVDCFLDIHQGNVMLDGNNAVLIDPVASR